MKVVFGKPAKPEEGSSCVSGADVDAETKRIEEEESEKAPAERIDLILRQTKASLPQDG